MTVASCPSCRETVTVPVDATPACIVRCPLCQEEFKLEEFLAQLPPTLIVLGEDGEAAEIHGVLDERSSHARIQGSDASPNMMASLDLAGRHAEAHDSVPAFDFTPGSVAAEEGETGTGPSRRHARRQKSATLEVVKIVAGALLAVPAAQLILWWFVPGDWKRDLLGIGPSVSRVVPWMVPKKFHAPAADFVQQRALERRDNDRIVVSAPGGARPRPDNGSATPGPDSSLLTPGRSLTEDGERTTSPAPEPSASSAATSAGVTELVNGVRSAPQYQTSDFEAALESALQISVAWDTNPHQSEQHRGQLSTEFYTRFARLGETVTYLLPGDPGARDLVVALQDLLRTFSHQAKKLAMIGNQSNEWLERADRPNQGIFLFGTVKQIRAAGQVFATELELASLKQRTLTIISRMDPGGFYQPRDRVLMLGAMVSNPAANLVGYEGSESTVVMGGFPVVLDP